MTAEDNDAQSLEREIVIRYTSGPTTGSEAVARYIHGHLQSLDAEFHVLVRDRPAQELRTIKATPNENTPYIVKPVVTAVRLYDPNFGDDRICRCGHPYHRHFDGYEESDSQDVGCKFCDCRAFAEKNRD